MKNLHPDLDINELKEIPDVNDKYEAEEEEDDEWSYVSLFLLYFVIFVATVCINRAFVICFQSMQSFSSKSISSALVTICVLFKPSSHLARTQRSSD